MLIPVNAVLKYVILQKIVRHWSIQNDRLSIRTDDG